MFNVETRRYSRWLAESLRDYGLDVTYRDDMQENLLDINFKEFGITVHLVVSLITDTREEMDRKTRELIRQGLFRPNHELFTLLEWVASILNKMDGIQVDSSGPFLCFELCRYKYLPIYWVLFDRFDTRLNYLI